MAKQIVRISIIIFVLAASNFFLVDNINSLSHLMFNSLAASPAMEEDRNVVVSFNSHNNNNNNNQSTIPLSPSPSSRHPTPILPGNDIKVANTTTSTSNINSKRKRKRKRRSATISSSSSAAQKPLLIYLHLHKAGGTTIVHYLQELGLKGIQHAKDYLNRNKGEDSNLRKREPNSFLIHSSTSSVNYENSKNCSSSSSSRVGDPSFWNAIHNQGVDFVSLEYNFITPTQFANISKPTLSSSSFSNSTIATDTATSTGNNNIIKFFTVMRDPWSRFHSTYERELYLVCQDRIKKQKQLNRNHRQQNNYTTNVSSLEENCHKENTMEIWMQSLDKKFPRQNLWGGTLYKNFYVRILNGINDQNVTIPVLNETHLQNAKDVLKAFDAVMLLDDPLLKSTVDNFLKNSVFTGSNNTDTLNDVNFLHRSNNKLKEWKTYNSIRNETEKYRKQFENENLLDLQLYDFVKNMMINAR